MNLEKGLKEPKKESLIKLRKHYNEYRQDRARLVEIMNYAREQYQKRYNHLKWKTGWEDNPKFIKGHFEDSQLDCLYQQAINAQNTYHRYRESIPLFNEEDFEFELERLEKLYQIS